MSEDAEKNFVLPNFTTPVPGTLMEVLDNDNTTREKINLKGLGTTKVEYGGVFMMLKTGMVVAQDYMILNYILPRL